MEQDVYVLTPEKTILSFQLSGISARIRAHVLDAVICLFMILAIAVVAGIALGSFDPALSQGLILFLSFACPLLYFVLLEGFWNGQTLGKKVCKLRVRMSDGTPITFQAAIARNLMRPADMLPILYFVGLLGIFTTEKGQRIGDLVAGTIVCTEPPAIPVFNITPHAAGIHPLEGSVGPLAGLTLEEYNVLRLFADRFPELPRAVQDDLVLNVWKPIAERRNVPAYANIHPIYLAEAVVMKYGREKGLL